MGMWLLLLLIKTILLCLQMNNRYSISLLFLMVAFSSLAADAFEVEGVWYEPTSESTVMVVEKPSSGTDGTSIIFRNCYEGDVIIAQMVSFEGVDYVVTAIKDGTFRQSEKLTGVTFPASLIDMGTMPFADCPNLSSIIVHPENPAFAVVDGLLYDKRMETLITCPGAREAEVSIPSSVTTISPSAFRGCRLTEIVIPRNVSQLGQCAFMRCAQLSKVNMADGITAFPDSAFCNCTSLTDFSFPTTVKTIGVNAFYHCDKLISLQLPTALESIGDNAFDLCYGLKTVSFPEGLASIGKWAFDNCSRISSLVIPSSVNDIAPTAFSGCSGLKSIVVADGNASYESLDGVLFDKGQTSLICYPGSKTGAYTVPSSVNTIGEYSFYYSTQLKNITIPSSVTTIGSNAFRLCTVLKGITLPSSVTSLGDNLFRACSALQTIVYYADTPPEISSSTFTSTNYNVPLHVLNRALDNYKNAPYWSQFSTILTIDGTVVDGMLGDVNNDSYINMSDVTIIINYILGKEVTDFKWQLADMNFDGFVNMSDVTSIINFILGKTSEVTDK